MLGIADQRVTLSLVRNPSEDPNAAGCCVQRPEHNACVIELPDNIEDTPEAHKTIIHELLHVCHSRIDHFYDEGVMRLLKGKARKLAEEAMKQHYESYINSMATALYEFDQKRQKK